MGVRKRVQFDLFKLAGEAKGRNNNWNGPLPGGSPKSKFQYLSQLALMAASFASLQK